MTGLHEEEGYVGPGMLHRISVPGGWLYYRDGYREAGTFVPAPPRLVRLEEKGGLFSLVNPSAVKCLRGKPEGPTFVDVGGPEDSVLTVKGTPSEVAARLGLEVTP